MSSRGWEREGVRRGVGIDGDEDGDFGMVERELFKDGTERCV